MLKTGMLIGFSSIIREHFKTDPGILVVVVDFQSTSTKCLI